MSCLHFLDPHLTKHTFTILLRVHSALLLVIGLLLLLPPHRLLPHFLLIEAHTTLSPNSVYYNPQLHELSRLFATQLLVTSFTLHLTSKSYDAPFRRSIAQAMILNHVLQFAVVLKACFGNGLGTGSATMMAGNAAIAAAYTAFIARNKIKLFELPVGEGI